MMKLYYTGNSPYARRPRIAWREAGLAGQIEEIDVTPRVENLDLLHGMGPSGKVPGLLTDGGTYLCESLIIARHLDEASGGKLYPAEGAAREAILELEGMASLLMDTLYVRSHEKRREEGDLSPAVLAAGAERCNRAYDALAKRLGNSDNAIDMGAITAVCSLGYSDWRTPEDEWRKGRDGLAAWFDRMMERDAMATTKVVV
jgi:glutathione S-transferase